ncbi:hypothetical protein [Parasediminibacterium sp. JCM 36343]|uniref:hypothetical protein n=1 Tax=Parasediminibacterium sp. JCM 36343 TaxID=3374279 RepID=UPI00397D4F17
MGITKEPLDVDFVVDPKPLTKEDALMISEFIKADKAKRALLDKKTTQKPISKKQKVMG